MLLKYEDVQDSVIQETLRYWRKNNPLTVFNQHLEGFKDTYDEFFKDDKTGLPYIWFKTVEGKKKKMFYPKSYAPNLNSSENTGTKDYIKNRQKKI